MTFDIKFVPPQTPGPKGAAEVVIPTGRVRLYPAENGGANPYCIASPRESDGKYQIELSRPEKSICGESAAPDSSSK